MNNLLLFGTPRLYRDRVCFDDLREDELFQRTRLTLPIIMQLKNLLYDDLARSTLRGRALDVESQLIAALTFYASGSFQWGVSNGAGISQSSICRSIEAVTNALCDRANNCIRFPTDHTEVREIKRGFHAISNFPNVIGCIDCTHICIKSLSSNEAPAYMNRKGTYSINVQAVCDHNLLIRDIVVRWLGSTHDSFIWRQSSLRECFERGLIRDGWLLGEQFLNLNGS